MKMNRLEQNLVNNPIRRAMLRHMTQGWLRSEGLSLRDWNILEIGCGQGAGTEMLLQRFDVQRVAAFDFDPVQLARATQRLLPRHRAAVSLFLGDAERLAFPADHFDAVVEFAIFHHLFDWRAALREVARVIKPGGYFFYEEYLKGFVTNPVIDLFLDHPEEGQFTADEFADGLRDAGLVPTATQHRFGGWWLNGVARAPEA